MWTPSNGILLNRCLHKLFDEYYFSINPETLKIEIADATIDLTINKYRDKIINIHPDCIPKMKIHYQKFVK